MAASLYEDDAPPAKRATYADVQRLTEDLARIISKFKHDFPNANDLIFAVKGKLMTQTGEIEINVKVKGTPPAPQGKLPGMFDDATMPPGVRAMRPFRGGDE